MTLNSAIAFLDRLSKAIRAGDTRYLLSHLDPAVVARYGLAQCASVVRQLKDPSLHLQLVQFSGPMTYNYHSDGLSALVPGVYVFKSTGMAAGTRGTHISHFASHNGDFRIFVDCGHPISSK